MEITQNTILKLIFRQGTDGERKSVVLASGEPGYTTDTDRLFIGDGDAVGGILVGNKFKGVHTSVSLLTTPAEIGDYAFNSDNNKFYVLETGDGSILSDWREVGGVYTGSGFIFVDPATNVITLLPLSAGAFDADAVEAPIIISSGRIGLSSNIPIETVSTHTITVSTGLLAFDGAEVDITNIPTNPLASDITITVDPTKTITFTSGLTATVGGFDFTDDPFSPLSGEVVVGVNFPTALPDVLARYDGLSGNVVVYSRNLTNVVRLSAGDYLFTYTIPTSAAYPFVELHGPNTDFFYPRVMSVSDTVCNVHVLSSPSSNVKTDANLFFRLIY